MRGHPGAFRGQFLNAVALVPHVNEPVINGGILEKIFPL